MTIVKTRHEAHAKIPPPGLPATDSLGGGRGILRSGRELDSAFHHARLSPCTALADFIQYYWTVRWDLRGLPPQLRETLPHPNTYLNFQAGLTGVRGVHTSRFSILLEGQGFVFGAKFRPGGLRPFLGRPVRTIANLNLSPFEVFGDGAQHLEAAIFACPEEKAMAEVLRGFLLGRLPPRDPNVDLAATIVEDIEADRGLIRVDDLIDRYRLGRRSLQRLFSDYVGVGPKWVIARYRLHEAVERLAGVQVPDLTALALELGYFDQAHFIRDFKRLVGRPPGEYVQGG